uniref:hypothetical protein n=1 Tax=Altererythrobacter segetis TaxID=1104773 RepID=UPI001409286E|nr:hypothetical protein [Altererythrobacter segetis]
MNLEPDLAEFLTGPVLLIVSAADDRCRPAIGRGVGASIVGVDAIEVILSRWQWPDVVRNIVSSGRLALTASRARDYVTYQLKGPAKIRDATPEDIECAQHYWAAITDELGRQNVPAYIVSQWSPDRDIVAAQLSVAEIYVQTPGPLAGTSL